jgi:NADPH:quinone reductase-like Zn-dependent oxidoreductase
MKVIELTGPGLDAMRLAEREIPPVPERHVRVRVSAASLNYRDLMIAKGLVPVSYPRIPLSDAVGEVTETGAGVSRVRSGDRVFAIFYPDWQSGPIRPEKFAHDRGATGDGVAAEYLVLPEEELVRVPDHLSDAAVATLPCAGVTAWSAITQNGGLNPGDSVLIQGTGGVSLFALQFALAAGAETWLISSEDAKLERAQALGAHHVVNYKSMPDWDATIIQATSGRGVDLVVDVVGQATLAKSVNAVTSGGRVAIIGVLGGFEASIPLYPVMTKSVHICGVISGNREDAEAMVRAVSAQAIRPVIDSEFALTDLPAALRHLESGKHFGKISIAIG